MDLRKIYLYGKESTSLSFYAYVDAYLDAYITLYKEIQHGENNNYKINYKHYPLVFLILHALELTLKNIIYIYERNENIKTHDIRKLYENGVRKFLSHCSRFISEQDIFLIGNLIEKFNDIKNHHLIFRYPDKKYHPESPKEIQNLLINIEDAEKLKRISGAMEDISCLLEDMDTLEFQREDIEKFDVIYTQRKEKEKIDLQQFNESKIKEVCIILKQYYSVPIRKIFPLTPRYISIEKIKKIIEVNQENERKLNEGLNENYQYIDETEPLWNIVKSLSNEEVIDLLQLKYITSGYNLANYYKADIERASKKSKDAIEIDRWDICGLQNHVFREIVEFFEETNLT